MSEFKIKWKGQTLKVRTMTDDEVIDGFTLQRGKWAYPTHWHRSDCMGETVGEHSKWRDYVKVLSKFFVPTAAHVVTDKKEIEHDTESQEKQISLLTL